MNAALVFEIAILMLAAFLAGAAIGALARWLISRPKPASVAGTEATPEAAATPARVSAELVKAPAIAPLRTPPTAAERLAAAGGMTSTVVMPKVSLPQAPAIEPSRRPGETVSGRHIDNPEHPASAAPAPEPATTQPIATESAENVATEAAAASAAASEVAAAEPESITTDVPEERLPVEERVEPAVSPDDLVVTDAPVEVAAELQDVVETETAGVAPAVVTEAPLVEPAVEREQHDVTETIADPIIEVEQAELPEAPIVDAPAAPSVSEPAVADVDDELAAMRAIEGGWRPKRPAAPRKPADLPEGVSPAHVAEAAKAVEKSGAAVANALAAAAAALEDMAPGGQPVALSAPRNGIKDDLGEIKGLGPAIESALNGLGIYHFDQIAAWDDSAVAWIETHFGFKGRIARERWQEQARDLAAAPAAEVTTP